MSLNYLYALSGFHCEFSGYFVIRLTVYFGRLTFNYLGKSSVYYVEYFMVSYSETFRAFHSQLSFYISRVFSIFSWASYGKLSGFIVWRLMINYLFFLSPSVYHCDIFVGLLIVNFRGFPMNILEVLSDIFSRASHCDFSCYLVGCVYFVDIFWSLTMLLSRFF